MAKKRYKCVLSDGLLWSEGSGEKPGTFPKATGHRDKFENATKFSCVYTPYPWDCRTVNERGRYKFEMHLDRVSLGSQLSTVHNPWYLRSSRAASLHLLIFLPLILLPSLPLWNLLVTFFISIRCDCVFIEIKGTILRQYIHTAPVMVKIICTYQ